MRVSTYHGQPVLQFRFGEGNWISLVLDANDLKAPDEGSARQTH